MPYHAIWLAPCEKSNRLNKTNLEIKKKMSLTIKKESFIRLIHIPTLASQSQIKV